MSDSVRLSTKKELAIALLLQGCSLSEVADRADITERTLRRWRNEDPNFARVHREAADKLFGEGISLLKGALPKAVRVLGELSESVEDNIRLRAATNLASLGVKAWEVAQEEGYVEEIREEFKRLQDEIRRLNRRRDLNG